MSKHGYTSNIVLDLEFTPTRLGKGALGAEIIEVGAVKVDARGNVVDEFSRMVKPLYSRGVSRITHRLTGIGNEDLTAARPLDAVLAEFAEWVGPGRVRMVTWSDADRLQLWKECAAKGILAGLPVRWLDIQRLYPRLYGIPRQMVALERACLNCGIPYEERSAHRALYDAKVTAELFQMMRSGDMRFQRARYEAELRRSQESTTLSSSIGDRCRGLAELYALLPA